MTSVCTADDDSDDEHGAATFWADLQIFEETKTNQLRPRNPTSDPNRDLSAFVLLPLGALPRLHRKVVERRYADAESA